MKFVWKVCFAWWVVPLFSWQMRRRFIADIRETFWFLFRERGGLMIANPHGSGRAYQDEIVFLADDLVFYFSTIANPDESGMDVRVAPAQFPRDSQDLTFALMLLDPSAPVQRRLWISPPFIALHLRTGFDALKQAFSASQFEATKQNIRHLEIHGNVART